MKIRLEATIEKFGSQGEKTGWNYIEIRSELAQKLYSKNKKSFKVKGLIDDVAIQGLALLPMGEGDYILPLSAPLRKKLAKSKGAKVKLLLELDTSTYELNKDMLEAIEFDMKAYAFFQSLSPSHQNYYSKWVDSAKTQTTIAKRIALIVTTLAMQLNYSEMMHYAKTLNKD